MNVTATLAAKKAEEKPQKTLADLDDDVLATVRLDGDHGSYPRFRHGSHAYSLENGDHGQVHHTGFARDGYVVLQVLVPLVFDFEN